MDDLIYLEGIASVSALVAALDSGRARRKIEEVYFDSSRLEKEYRRARFLRSAAERLGFEFAGADPEFISSIAGGRTHGGIIARVTPAVFPELRADLIPPTGFCAFLDGAEDPYTLGNCIRSLWCCGADALVLPGRIPSGADAVVARASAGISELMPVYLSDPAECVELFSAAGYRTVCAGLRDSVPCTCADMSRPVLLVVGGEKRGISAAVRERCSLTVRIPYGRDFIGSLSTSAALAVLAYEIMNQNSPDRNG